MTALGSVTAFQGSRRIASGTLIDVATAAKAAMAERVDPVLIFDDSSSEVLEVDFRGSEDDVRARLAPAAQHVGRGRPKLGVVAREVTLLPRHWEWLAAQSGGASATLRRLIDEARRSAAGERRRAQTSLYRFMTTMAGDAAGYEDAIRALFAGDRSRFNALTEDWAPDIRDHAGRLAPAAFGEPPLALDR